MQPMAKKWEDAMAQIYFGRVCGSTAYTTCEQSTAGKMITVQKNLVSPNNFEPVVGDVVIFANGDVRQVTFMDDLFVKCGGVMANLQTKQDDLPVHILKGRLFAKN